MDHLNLARESIGEGGFLYYSLILIEIFRSVEILQKVCFHTSGVEMITSEQGSELMRIE
jgi:hypothetical protein